MNTHSVAVNLPSNVTYVSGTVNGVEYVWTNTKDDVWEATVEKSQDGTYVVTLEIINTLGVTTNEKFTLFYGVVNLITDRTSEDVERWKTLLNKGWSRMSDEERAEWLTPMKGSYNSTDMNRVESAVEYIAELFVMAGYSFVPKVKTTWQAKDRPTIDDMKRYFDNVAKLRSLTDVYSTTPAAPTMKNNMDWQTANDLEQILSDICAALRDPVREPVHRPPNTPCTNLLYRS